MIRMESKEEAVGSRNTDWRDERNHRSPPIWCLSASDAENDFLIRLEGNPVDEAEKFLCEPKAWTASVFRPELIRICVHPISPKKRGQGVLPYNNSFIIFA